MNNLKDAMRTILGLLFLVGIIFSFFPDKGGSSKPTKSKIMTNLCLEQATRIHNKQDAEVNTKIEQLILNHQSTIALELQSRRLNEVFCMQEANCLFPNETEVFHASTVSAEFSNCLSKMEINNELVEDPTPPDRY